MGPGGPPQTSIFWSQKWHFPDFLVRGSVEGRGLQIYPLARNQYINNSPGIFPVFAWVRIPGSGLRIRTQRAKTSENFSGRKQSSAKILKISRSTLKSSRSDIFYFLRNLLKYLLRTSFASEVFALCVLPGLFPKYRRGMYSHRNEFPQDYDKHVKIIPRKYSPVFARVRIQAPHVFGQN